MKKALTISIALFICQLLVLGQQKAYVLEYIAKYKDIAIEEMARCKIPASITLAQGIHESSCGKSPLSQQANNHFGIKCKSDWEGKKFFKDDDAPNECFRVYEHASDSYADHSDFLLTHSRYASLFQLPISDYKSWAYGIKAAGYATNPKYSEILISTIELYNLSEYDKAGLALIQQNENLLTPSEKQESPMVNNAPVAYSALVVSNIATITTTEVSNKAQTSEPANTIVTDHIAVSNLSNVRKEYIINGSRALKAQDNEDPLKIALDYGLDLERILSFNDLGPNDHFKDGEYIFLQTKKGKGSQEKHVAQSGESMRDISQMFGIKLQELYLKNEMKYTENEQVLAGEAIFLQEKRITAPKTMAYSAFLKSNDKNATGTIPAPNNNQYRVQQSDTLFTIAQKFNLSVEELKAMNNLQNNPIRPGQTLVVSK